MATCYHSNQIVCYYGNQIVWTIFFLLTKTNFFIKIWWWPVHTISILSNWSAHTPSFYYAIIELDLVARYWKLQRVFFYCYYWVRGLSLLYVRFSLRPMKIVSASLLDVCFATHYRCVGRFVGTSCRVVVCYLVAGEHTYTHTWWQVNTRTHTVQCLLTREAIPPEREGGEG